MVKKSIKSIAVFSVKAIALLLVVYAAARMIQHLPLLGVMLIFLAFILAYTFYFTYRSLMKKSIALMTFRSGGWAHYFLSRRFFSLIFSFLAGTFLTLVLFAELSSWQRSEWLLIVLMPPIYYLCQKLSHRLLAKESEPSLLHYRAALWASVMSAFIMVIVGALVSWIFIKPPEYHNFAGTYAAMTMPDAKSVAIREYFNFFVQYLGTIKAVVLARAGELNSSVAKSLLLLTSVRFAAFLSLASLLSLLALPFGEYLRVMRPAQDSKHKVSRTAIFAAVISLLLYVVFICGMLHLEEYALMHPTDHFRTTVLEYTGEVVERFDAVAVDNQLYSAKVMERRREAQSLYLQEFARSHKELVTLANAVFDRMILNVDDYLDWYYSLSAEYFRLFKLAVGDIENHMEEQLTLRLGAGEEMQHLQDALTSSEKMFVEYSEDMQRILEENHIENPSGYTVVESYSLDNFISVMPDTPELYSFQQRLGIGGVTVAGFTLAGGVFAKKIVAAVAVKSGFKAAVGAAGKIALTKVAGGVAGGAAGAGVGAVAGSFIPGAGTAAGAVVGFVAGLAAGVGLDKAMLALDETVNREALRQEIIDAINAERDNWLHTVS